MIAGIGLWKWVQITDKIGVCIDLCKYPTLKGRWSVDLLPRLEIRSWASECSVYSLRFMFLIFGFCIDIEKIH
jgi:hypothetical protein